MLVHTHPVQAEQETLTEDSRTQPGTRRRIRRGEDEYACPSNISYSRGQARRAAAHARYSRAARTHDKPAFKPPPLRFDEVFDFEMFAKSVSPCVCTLHPPLRAIRDNLTVPAILEPIRDGWNYSSMLKRVYAAVQPGLQVWGEHMHRTSEL